MTVSDQDSDYLFRVALGEAIRVSRVQAGLSQTQVGVRIGVSHSYVGHIEKGRRLCTLPLLRRISKLLGMSLAGLILLAESMLQAQSRSA